MDERAHYMFLKMAKNEPFSDLEKLQCRETFMKLYQDYYDSEILPRIKNLSVHDSKVMHGVQFNVRDPYTANMFDFELLKSIPDLFFKNTFGLKADTALSKIIERIDEAKIDEYNISTANCVFEPLYTHLANFFEYETVFYPEPYQISFVEPASIILVAIRDLHDSTIFHCSIAFFSVSYFLFLCLKDLFTDKHSSKMYSHKVATAPLFEILWTCGPILLLFFILFPSLSILYRINGSSFSWQFRPFIFATIKVIGNQWYWLYEVHQFNEIISFESRPLPNKLLVTDNPLVLAVDEFTRLNITSNDVIHSFALPSLGLKMDAIPGRINTYFVKPTFTSKMFGQCSELCGIGHGLMPIHVEVVSFKGYICWAALLHRQHSSHFMRYSYQTIEPNSRIIRRSIDLLTSIVPYPAVLPILKVNYCESLSTANDFEILLLRQLKSMSFVRYEPRVDGFPGRQKITYRQEWFDFIEDFEFWRSFVYSTKNLCDLFFNMINTPLSNSTSVAFCLVFDELVYQLFHYLLKDYKKLTYQLSNYSYYPWQWDFTKPVFGSLVTTFPCSNSSKYYNELVKNLVVRPAFTFMDLENRVLDIKLGYKYLYDILKNRHATVKWFLDNNKLPKGCSQEDLLYLELYMKTQFEKYNQIRRGCLFSQYTYFPNLRCETYPSIYCPLFYVYLHEIKLRGALLECDMHLIDNMDYKQYLKDVQYQDKYVKQAMELATKKFEKEREDEIKQEEFNKYIESIMNDSSLSEEKKEFLIKNFNYMEDQLLPENPYKDIYPEVEDILFK
jgi:cytochrome c oxidase subunit 2